MATTLQDLDQAKINHFHLLVTFLSGMGVFLEGYDFTNIGAALIFLIPYYHLTPLATSWLAVSTYLGTIVGALAAGYLADRFGRRHLYMVDMIAYTFFGLLSAVSFNAPMLFLARVGLGFGIGADQALSFTIIGEFSPRKSRRQSEWFHNDPLGYRGLQLLFDALSAVAVHWTKHVADRLRAFRDSGAVGAHRAASATGDAALALNNGLASEARLATEHTLSGRMSGVPDRTRNVTISAASSRLKLAGICSGIRASGGVQFYVLAMWGLAAQHTASASLRR